MRDVSAWKMAGEPFAMGDLVVGPVQKPSFKSPKGAWAGKVEIVGDIVNFDTSHLWEVSRLENCSTRSLARDSSPRTSGS